MWPHRPSMENYESRVQSEHGRHQESAPAFAQDNLGWMRGFAGKHDPGNDQVSTGFGDWRTKKANKLYKPLWPICFWIQRSARQSWNRTQTQLEDGPNEENVTSISNLLPLAHRVLYRGLEKALEAPRCENWLGWVWIVSRPGTTSRGWTNKSQPPASMSRPVPQGGTNPKPLRSLEFVHKERIDAIHEYHFSEERMKLYRGSSLCQTRRPLVLEQMSDEDIRTFFVSATRCLKRKRFKNSRRNSSSNFQFSAKKS